MVRKTLTLTLLCLAVFSLTVWCSDDGDNPCGDRECGEVDGTRCGTCAGSTEVCSAEGICLDVCADRDCGEWEGVDCGTCGDATAVCTVNGFCVGVCQDRECGLVGEVDCGRCTPPERCSLDGRCVQPGCPADMVEMGLHGVCIDAWEYTVERFAAFLNDHGDDCSAGFETEHNADHCLSSSPEGIVFQGGTLACSANCTYDVSGCLTQGPLCGNDRAEGEEACDGTDLQGLDCVSLAAGFVGGTLACSVDCTFDVSSCLPPECGDGEADPPEPCDGADLRGNTCTTLGLGFTGGDLVCSESCSFDTSGCWRDPVCGNDIAEPGEACDGADLRLASCVTHGFGGGILACAADCTVDIAGCTGDRCAILNLYGDGLCDACGLTGGTMDPDCSLCSVADGTCGPPDQLDPFLDQSTCLLATGAKDPDCGSCGDGVASAAEQCDTADTGETTCRSLGFDHGTLACDAGCELDLSDCEGFCGDGSKDPGEFCDGNDLGGMDCATLGLGPGQLACFGSCTYNTLGCTPLPVAVCGDGVAAIYEACDGPDLAGDTCQSVGFTGGNLFCRIDCTFDFSECIGDLCALAGWYSNGVCDPCQEYGGSPDPDCAACSVTDGQCSPPDTWHPHFSTSTCLLVTGASDPDCGTCGDGTASSIEHCDGGDLKGLTCVDVGFSGGTLACSASCHLSFTGCQWP